MSGLRKKANQILVQNCVRSSPNILSLVQCVGPSHVLAQLAERSPPTPVDRSSNTVDGNFHVTIINRKYEMTV